MELSNKDYLFDSHLDLKFLFHDTLWPRPGYVSKSLSTPFRAQTVLLSVLSSESSTSCDVDAQTLVCPVSRGGSSTQKMHSSKSKSTQVNIYSSKSNSLNSNLSKSKYSDKKNLLK